jgi:hypothetical protein
MLNLDAVCHAEFRCRFHVLCWPELWFLLGEFYQTTWTFQTIISSQNFQILDLYNCPLLTVSSWENFDLENYFIGSLFSQKFDIIKSNLTRHDQKNYRTWQYLSAKCTIIDTPPVVRFTCTYNIVAGIYNKEGNTEDLGSNPGDFTIHKFIFLLEHTLLIFKI